MHLFADPQSKSPVIPPATLVMYHQQQHTPNGKDYQVRFLFPLHTEHVSDFARRV